MTSDPVRLLEDPSAGAVLRSDLVHAAEVEVHGLDVVAGLAALQKATATVTSSTTVVASTSLLTKLGVGTGVAVGAVVLWLGLGGGPEAGDGERVAAPAVASAPALEDEDPRGGLGPAGKRVEGTAAPVRSDVPPAPAKPEPAQPNDGALDSAAAGEAGATEPASEISPDAEADEPRPASTARRKGATGARSSGEKPAKTTQVPADDVLREAQLVAKARGQLTRDPARALALAEEAERDFPQGQLVEERRAIAIRALVALGRLDEAQRRAEPFLAEYGRGAHAAAVRRALEPDTDAP